MHLNHQPVELVLYSFFKKAVIYFKLFSSGLFNVQRSEGLGKPGINIKFFKDSSKNPICFHSQYLTHDNMNVSPLSGHFSLGL